MAWQCSVYRTSVTRLCVCVCVCVRERESVCVREFVSVEVVVRSYCYLKVEDRCPH